MTRFLSYKQTGLLSALDNPVDVHGVPATLTPDISLSLTLNADAYINTVSITDGSAS